MSINLTQKFCFETDSLDSFEKMLETISKIMFHEPDKYINHHIQVVEPSYWQDGKDYRNMWDNCQPILAESSNLLYNPGKEYHLLKFDGIFGGASFLKLEQSFFTRDEASKASMSHKKEPNPTRLFVARLSDYSGDYNKEGGDIHCRSIDNMINNSMKILRNFDTEKLFQKLGDGYNEGFNSDDGSVDVGYRMHQEPCGGWDYLVISLVHMYYGK